MNFEAKLKRIEEILKQLESGDVTLEDSMKLFEEGVTITSECRKYLKEYQGKFTVIREELENERTFCL